MCRGHVRLSGVISVMCCRALAAMFVVALLMLSTASGQSDPPPSLTMNVALNASADGRYDLEVTLSNHGKEMISVWAVKLPWAPDNWHLWIKAIKLNKRRSELSPSVAMIDYGGEVDFPPGVDKRGGVPLHGMYKTLLHDIGQHGVRIEWRCPTDLLSVKCPDVETRYIISKGGIRRVAPPPPVVAPSSR